MNNEITVTVEGWVAKPPQRFGKDEDTWVVFRVGSTAWWRDSQGTVKEAPTAWFDVKIGQEGLVDGVLLSLKPGDPVIVNGRLSPRSWVDRDGKPRTTMQIAARSVGHNLRWGKSIFKRHTSGSANARLSVLPGGAGQSRQAEDGAGPPEDSALAGARPAGEMGASPESRDLVGLPGGGGPPAQEQADQWAAPGVEGGPGGGPAASDRPLTPAEAERLAFAAADAALEEAAAAA
ncbi:MAG: single-stranded DNA-binding protein [Bifidobacteriaceae bacterium]|jgi:single-strand DNA-binding protein|nr:single-stranded DNA-binding protein [Bifidobacteriaceae bacterium]